MNNAKTDTNKNYKVLGIARDSDSLEQYVVYETLCNDQKFGKNALWVKKLDGHLNNPSTEQTTNGFTPTNES